MSSTNATKPQVKPARRRTWRGRLKRLGNGIANRSSDLALWLIIAVAGFAAFDGALYSAREFHFEGDYAKAFALLPDALMILSAAKMRGLRVHPEQRKTAHRSMRFGLAFSVITNMVAASLRLSPENAWWMPYVEIVGTLAYHGVVVVILWLAVETVTKVRQDAPSITKQDNESKAGRAGGVNAEAKGRKASEPPKAPKQPTAPKPAPEKVPVTSLNGTTPSGLVIAKRV